MHRALDAAAVSAAFEAQLSQRNVVGAGLGLRVGDSNVLPLPLATAGAFVVLLLFLALLLNFVVCKPSMEGYPQVNYVISTIAPAVLLAFLSTYEQ